jgi:hypothetical protein
MENTIFQFTDEQIELLNNLRKRINSEYVQNTLQNDRVEHIDKFGSVLADAGFPENDLDEDHINQLFWHMRRVMHNRALGSNLYSNIGLISFNEGLRTLFDEDLPLVQRIDRFLDLGGIGKVTTSHFLFMYDFEKYPLTTIATREVLDLDENQIAEAGRVAAEKYDIERFNPEHTRTLQILADVIIFSKVKEILEVDDFYTVNLVLWAESRERMIPEADEDIDEYQESMMVASREDDLQEYLVNHPELIGDGLEVIERELNADSAGRIDILMKDRASHYVVIETKKGRSSDAVVGQISRYMGWVIQNRGGPVRGVIVVANPDDRLLLAIAPHSNLSIKYYRKYYKLSDTPFIDNNSG